MPRLIASVEQPFYKMQNPLLKSVSTWVTDKKTNAEFSKLGKQLASTMNEIMNAFGGKNVNSAKVLDSVIQGITKAVKNFGDMVVQNKDSIKTEIIVKEQKINVLRIDNKEFISLTDLARYVNPEEPKIPIYAWMRNKDVIAYLGLWEQLNNENFKGHEFETLSLIHI